MGNIEAYSSAKSRPEKVKVVDNVMSQIRNSGIRIVKFDSKINMWYELSKSEAHQKCGHCLRDTIRSHKERRNRKFNVHSRNNTSSVAIKKKRKVLTQKNRQARNIFRHQQQYQQPINDEISMGSIEDLVNYVDDSNYEDTNNYLPSLLTNWNNDDIIISKNVDNFTNPTRERYVINPRRRTSSIILFEDEYPELNIDFSPSTFFTQ